MSQAFQLHHRLATTARSKTAQAISLDESRQNAQALAAYDKAAELLSSYTRTFSVGQPAYAHLAPNERATVSQTLAKLKSHLSSVIERRNALRNPSSHNAPSQTPPSAASASKLDRNDPLVKAIEAEILDNSTKVQWDDIYGLDEAKRALHEMVVLPAMRPDLYTGLRAPGRGILLFGPPGTGKTLIAKAVATNVNATFFSISASSLNSKFHGESEKLVRTLFAVARERQPSFVFIDEVDSILGSRSENEHEASRRLKTEFMAQFDGAIGGAEDRVYVMAASNRPQDLDDAVRRRLDRRIYVPLPDANGRKEFFRKLTMKSGDVRWALSATDFDTLSNRTVHFSGSDIKALCREASLMPLRELGTRVSQVHVSEVRACNMGDFEQALQIVRPSSNRQQIAELEKWNREFGSQSSTIKRSATAPVGPVAGGQGASKPSTLHTTSISSQALVAPRRNPPRKAKGSTTSKSKWMSQFFLGNPSR